MCNVSISKSRADSVGHHRLHVVCLDKLMPLYNKACKFRLLIMNCSNLTAENRVKLFAHQAVISPLDFFLYFLFSFVFVFVFFTFCAHNAGSLPQLHCPYTAAECEHNTLSLGMVRSPNRRHMLNGVVAKMFTLDV